MKSKVALSVVCLFIALSVLAQSAEERIGSLMGEGRWFELGREMRNEALKDSVNPVLYGMAVSMNYHYFNRPDSACKTLGELLGAYQDQLGGNTLSMATLLGMNLRRSGRYAEAADLMQSLADQMSAQGMDSTTIAGYAMFAKQCRGFAGIGDVCRPLHKAEEYRVPIVYDGRMHEASGDSLSHFICVKAQVNGNDDLFILDTGAGVNVITKEQAEKLGMRQLDIAIVMQGFGTVHGRYVLADTLRIGGMTWVNVPFAVNDFETGHAEADKVTGMMRPVIGLPVMLTMNELWLDFDNNELVVPKTCTPNPLGYSNMIRTDGEGLRVESELDSGEVLHMHLDTGGFYNVMTGKWYDSHKTEIDAIGTPDSLRMAGAGGVLITRSYRIPNKCFKLGKAVACVDSLEVNTGIDLHTGVKNDAGTAVSDADGTIGLELLECFKRVIINFRDMYIVGMNPRE